MVFCVKINVPCKPVCISGLTGNNLLSSAILITYWLRFIQFYYFIFYLGHYVLRGLCYDFKKTYFMADVNELGKSISFEVFEIKENKDSHSVFESGAGICYGFKSNDGVAFTDSTTYYVDKSKQQYYASIIGATVSSGVEPQNVQYAPVFNIQDPNLDREVKSEEQRNGKALVNKNLKKNKEILSNVVCK